MVFNSCRHYVPAVSNAVHKHMKKHSDSPFGLKGFAIGNGLTDPAIQYGAYATYALRKGLISQTYHDVIKAVSIHPHESFEHALM